MKKICKNCKWSKMNRPIKGVQTTGVCYHGSHDGKIILTVWNMWSSKWQKQNFRKLIFKFALLKLIKKNKMDFGDVLFDWKNKKGLEVSQRYYHAFRKRELKKICKKAGLKVKKFKKDAFNYYLVLEK